MWRSLNISCQLKFWKCYIYFSSTLVLKFAHIGSINCGKNKFIGNHVRFQFRQLWLQTYSCCICDLVVLTCSSCLSVVTDCVVYKFQVSMAFASSLDNCICPQWVHASNWRECYMCNMLRYSDSSSDRTCPTHLNLNRSTWIKCGSCVKCYAMICACVSFTTILPHFLSGYGGLICTQKQFWVPNKPVLIWRHFTANLLLMDIWRYTSPLLPMPSVQYFGLLVELPGNENVCSVLKFPNPKVSWPICPKKNSVYLAHVLKSQPKGIDANQKEGKRLGVSTPRRERVVSWFCAKNAANCDFSNFWLGWRLPAVGG